MSKLKLAIPTINRSNVWGVDSAERLTAYDNRPGLKMIYVTVVDKMGRVLPWVKVRFDAEPNRGVVEDHPNWWGYTDDKGHVEWCHLGLPTRYRLFMGDEPYPLIVNIRTDLPEEYYKTGWWYRLIHPLPANRPGVYSYRIKIRRRY